MNPACATNMSSLGGKLTSLMILLLLIAIIGGIVTMCNTYETFSDYKSTKIDDHKVSGTHYWSPNAYNTTRDCNNPDRCCPGNYTASFCKTFEFDRDSHFYNTVSFENSTKSLSKEANEQDIKSKTMQLQDNQSPMMNYLQEPLRIKTKMPYLHGKNMYFGKESLHDICNKNIASANRRLAPINELNNENYQIIMDTKKLLQQTVQIANQKYKHETHDANHKYGTVLRNIANMHTDMCKDYQTNTSDFVKNTCMNIETLSKKKPIIK